MDKIEKSNDDIDINKLAFVGSDRKKFNFNIFRMPLNFLSATYNVESSLKKAEFKQRYLEKEIENLYFYYTPRNKDEKEEKIQVLMHANELLESRNKINKAFKDDIFLFEHLKKLDDVAYDFMLKNVDQFIQEIRSIEKKINLSLFKEFFEYSSPADYAKELINTKNVDKNKEYVEEIKDRISDLKDRIEQMSDEEKIYNNAYETLEIIDKIIDYSNNVQNIFHCASKVDKKNQNQRLKKVLQREQN